MPIAQELDRRIMIEAATVTQNELNEDVQTWAPVATVWAKRRDVSDGEKFAAGQVGSVLQTRFTVRSSETTRAVNATNRIQYDGSIWAIHGVKEADEGRNRFIEITAAKDAD